SITAGNTGGAFALDPASGQLTVAIAAAVDFETNPTFVLTVRVSDGNGGTADATVRVNLTDVAPTAPADADAAANAVTEGAAAGTPVGITARSTDPNGPAVTYPPTNHAGGR